MSAARRVLFRRVLSRTFRICWNVARRRRGISRKEDESEKNAPGEKREFFFEEEEERGNIACCVLRNCRSINQSRRIVTLATGNSLAIVIRAGAARRSRYTYTHGCGKIISEPIKSRRHPFVRSFVTSCLVTSRADVGGTYIPPLYVRCIDLRIDELLSNERRIPEENWRESGAQPGVAARVHSLILLNILRDTLRGIKRIDEPVSATSGRFRAISRARKFLLSFNAIAASGEGRIIVKFIDTSNRVEKARACAFRRMNPPSKRFCRREFVDETDEILEVTERTNARRGSCAERLAKARALSFRGIVPVSH